jgi:hypothetical protein
MKHPLAAFLISLQHHLDRCVNAAVRAEIPWNVSSRVALGCMRRFDLMLGSAILAVLVVVIINGIVWSVV